MPGNLDGGICRPAEPRGQRVDHDWCRPRPGGATAGSDSTSASSGCGGAPVGACDLAKARRDTVGDRVPRLLVDALSAAGPSRRRIRLLQELDDESRKALVV